MLWVRADALLIRKVALAIVDQDLLPSFDFSDNLQFLSSLLFIQVKENIVVGVTGVVAKTDQAKHEQKLFLFLQNLSMFSKIHVNI